MSSIGSFYILGRLGSDWKQDTNNNELYKNTIFINKKDNNNEVFFVNAWQKIGENLAKFSKKGDQILLKCILTSSFNKETGKQYLSINVRGFDFIFGNNEPLRIFTPGILEPEKFKIKLPDDQPDEPEEDKILWD